MNFSLKYIVYNIFYWNNFFFNYLKIYRMLVGIYLINVDGVYKDFVE